MKYSIEQSTLSALGDAIREKTGKYTKIDRTELREDFALSIPGKNWPDASYIRTFEFNQIKIIINHCEGDFGALEYRIGANIISFDENNEYIHSGDFYSLGWNDWRVSIGVRNRSTEDAYLEYTIIPMLDGTPIYTEAEVPNLMAPGAMPDAIRSIETGGGDMPEEALHLSYYKLNERFKNNNWNWFIDLYGDKITTDNIDNLNDVFSWSNNLTKIPFVINCVPDIVTLNNTFNGCESLTEIEPFGHINVGGLPSAFSNCRKLTTEVIENLFKNASFDDVQEAMEENEYAGELNNAFEGCYSLRRLPMDLIRNLFNPNGDPGCSIYSNGFRECISLDEVVDLPVSNREMWDNCFGETVQNCYRLKDFTFETNEDGTPKTARWAYQHLNLSEYVGWCPEDCQLFNYNSGITENDLVSDAASYEAKHSSENWFTTKPEFSRYNYESALNTINSLPDCSAFVEETGEGMNTIVFRGDMGSNTEAGAISNLTEEEIAVAAAKGWQVVIE